MFSFIHTADIHLDSPLHGLSKHADAPVEEIRGATRKALANIVQLALEKQVDFVVIAGDLYDGDWPDYSTGQFFSQQMRKLQSASILVYLITGNHDAASKITKTLTPPDNVHLFSTKKPETKTHPRLPVSLHGQGFAKVSESENLAINYPAAVDNHFNIGILHTSLAGNPEHDTYAPCSLNDLVTRHYHYWALGHIHQHAVLHEHPTIVYSGNPQGRHIRELGVRGCYYIEVNDSLEIDTLSFEPTDIVRWEHLTIDTSSISETSELREVIAEQMSHTFQHLQQTSEVQLLALRVTLTGSTTLHGELHAYLARWQAECYELAQDVGGNAIWFEQLKVKTSPSYDVKELAERDELTSIVLNALNDFNPSESKPSQVENLLGKLKTVKSDALSSVIHLEDKAAQTEFNQEIASIVLQSISQGHQ